MAAKTTTSRPRAASSKPTTTVRRPPADRQPTKSDALAAAEQPPVGHDLMTPVEQLRSGDQIEIQAELMDLYAALGFDFDEAAKAKEQGLELNTDIETTPDALRAIGRMGKVLEAHVVPGREQDFIEFDTGRGATTRVMELGQWYMARLGESDGSAS